MLNKQILELLENEIKSARMKFPKPINSYHEALGLLLEEVDEFKLEVYKKQWEKDNISSLKELIQIMALCNIIIEDLDLFNDNALNDEPWLV